MAEHEAIVIGAGQAGLAVSRELSRASIAHVVLESGGIAESWRRRWESFCLVTPNWSVQLPGFHYDGADPDGFMLRDEIVAYLERYAASFAAPVEENVTIESVVSRNGAGFIVESTNETYRAPSLILATGAFQRPHRPHGETLPVDLLQTDVGGYRGPSDLPPGGVLVVGSGQSGCQIAEELHHAGRRVVLSCGRAPWAPRRINDRDLFWWLSESGFLDARVESLPSPAARLFANVLATGHDGGHDIHLRTLRRLGVELVGHFLGASGRTARFAPDLAETVAWSDERYDQLKGVFSAFADREGLATPDMAPPEAFDPAAPSELDLADVGTVLFAGGFRPDYSWLPWPSAFDDLGFPIQQDGSSAKIEGLSFVGAHFLRKRKSSLLIGVGEDATIVAQATAARVGRSALPPS